MTHMVNVLYQRPYTFALRLLLSNSGVPMFTSPTPQSCGRRPFQLRHSNLFCMTVQDSRPDISGLYGDFPLIKVVLPASQR